MKEAMNCACAECPCTEYVHPLDPAVCISCRNDNHEREAQ